MCGVESRIEGGHRECVEFGFRGDGGNRLFLCCIAMLLLVMF